MDETGGLSDAAAILGKAPHAPGDRGNHDVTSAKGTKGGRQGQFAHEKVLFGGATEARSTS